MTKQKHARLKGILDRLGPGLSLYVENSILISIFGRGNTIKEAEKFAQDNECVFLFEPGKPSSGGVGVFGRAYSKKTNDEA